MKAVFFDKHGGPEVLRFGDFHDPQIGPQDVLVRLEASALNHVDLFVRAGIPGLTPKLPHILGSDGAGEIAAIGAEVKQWQVGDKVVINANLCLEEDEFTRAGQENLCRSWELLGETVPGTYAELVAIPEKNIIRRPEHISAAEAAAAALVFLTAWHSLSTKGKVVAGETVLILGASGGVNSASIQVAKYLGAEVIVVGSSKEKLELAAALGADHLINRNNEEWSKAAYMLTKKRGVDVVVDNVGSTFPQSMRVARKGGRILNVGRTGGHLVEIDISYIFGKHLSIIGSTMGSNADFETVMNLVFDGKLKAVVDKHFALADAAKAHQRLESGQQMGKIILDIA